MNGIWRRRTIRHLVIGLAPLLLVGAVLVVVLAARFADVAGGVREATGEAPATVTRSGLGADRRQVELRWRDASGAERLSLIRVPAAADVSTGATVTLRYVPSDPTRVYVGGDETSIRLRDLAYGVFVTAVVVLVALTVTVVKVLRRLRTERRPATAVSVTYARSKRGLVQRSWLIVGEQGREWWVPVHWERVLATLPAKAPASVHGRPVSDSALVLDVDGTHVWQSGRKRPTEPAGQVVVATPTSTSARRPADEATSSDAGSLVRQFRGDAALLVAAPLLGLLWAYVDGSGTVGFAAATLVAVGVLFWLPSMLGTDPA